MRRLPRKIRRGRAFRYRPDGHDGLDVIAAVGNAGHLDLGTGFEPPGRVGNNEIICRDGYPISAIAGRMAHCLPRSVATPGQQPSSRWERPWGYSGPYTHLECLLPEFHDTPLLLRVPEIRAIIAGHGGIAYLHGHVRTLRAVIDHVTACWPTRQPA